MIFGWCSRRSIFVGNQLTVSVSVSVTVDVAKVSVDVVIDVVVTATGGGVMLSRDQIDERSHGTGRRLTLWSRIP